jgi:hypothetical protein
MLGVSDSNSNRISRRGFLAAGAAIGGAVIWAPSLAFGQTVLEDIRALKIRVKDAQLFPNLEKNLLDELNSAIAGVKSENTEQACGAMSNFISDVQEFRGSMGLGQGEADTFTFKAQKIMAKIPCGPTGTTGETGSTGPTGPTGPSGPTGA